MLKFLLFLKRLTQKEFYSCGYIQHGINFAQDNRILTCCFSNNDRLSLYNPKLNKDIIKSLKKNRKSIISRMKKGNIPECCKGCVNLSKKHWSDTDKIQSITLNYYKICNLRCTHCGYFKNKESQGKDTDDKFVLDTVKMLEHKNMTTPNYLVDVGGGEPSLNNKLDEIIAYFVANKHTIHINSYVAKFKENYIDGIQNGYIKLTLTPDAGSRDIYKKIKGADYFETVKENLKKYMSAASDRIEVKFILEEGNLCDIDNMINLCLECGVKNVVCSRDLNIKECDFPKYKPYFQRFKTLCEQNELNLRYSLIPKEFLRKDSYA